MLLPLFEYLSEFFGPFRVVEFLSTRAILATLTSLLFSLILGPKFINKMKDIQVGQVIREEGPDSHLSKQGTPTMGGTLILSSIFLSVVLWGDLENRYLWVAFLTAMSFGVLGWIDDRLKIKHQSSDGLSPLNKIFPSESKFQIKHNTKYILNNLSYFFKICYRGVFFGVF